MRIALIASGPTISNLKAYSGTQGVGVSIANGSRFNLRADTFYTVTYTDSNEGDRIFSFTTSRGFRPNSLLTEPRGVDYNAQPNGQLVITNSAAGAAAAVSSTSSTTDGVTPFTVTFTFSRHIQDFDLTDIHAVLTNAVASDLTVVTPGLRFTALITPTGEGDIIVGLDAGAVLDNFGVLNEVAARLTIPLIDKTQVRQRTSRIISNFMTRRGDAIVSNQPDLAERLNPGGNGTGGLGASFSGEGSYSNNRMAFATSLRKVMSANKTNKAAEVSELGEMMKLGLQSNGTQSLGLRDHATDSADDGAPTGFDIWVRGRWARYENNTNEGDLGLLFIGADYKFNDGLVVGLVAQFDWTDEADDTEGFMIEGRGWMVGPYMVARLHQNLIFDANASWGRSDNQVSPFNTYTDSFEGTRWLASAKFTGSFQFGHLNVAPHIGVNYFQERQDAYVDSLSIDIPSQTIKLGRLTFGPKFSTTIQRKDGTTINPYVGISGLWDFERTAIVDLTTGLASESTDGIRTRLDTGVKIRLPDGLTLNGEGFYDGIGANDYKSYGGSIRVGIPLQRDDTAAATKLGITPDEAAGLTPRQAPDSKTDRAIGDGSATR